MTKGKVDFALNAFGVTKERREVSAYISFDDNAYAHMYIRNPRETMDWEVYTKPLRLDTWIALLIFCLIIPIIVKLLTIDCKYFFIFPIIPKFE